MDCEPCQCSTRSLPVARKEHRCCECRGYIEKGETYEVISGIWDGEPARFKTCSDCFDLRKRENIALERQGDYDGIPLGMLWEHLDESEGLLSQIGQEFLAIKLKRGATIGRHYWDWLRDHKGKAKA